MTVNEPTPTWWNALLEARWQRMRSLAEDEWDREVPVASLLRRVVAEEAAAFGYGARRAYPDQRWDAHLAARLENVWSAGYGSLHPWDQVEQAVRYGWKRGGAREPRKVARRHDPASERKVEARARAGA